MPKDNQGSSQIFTGNFAGSNPPLNQGGLALMRLVLRLLLTVFVLGQSCGQDAKAQGQNNVSVSDFKPPDPGSYIPPNGLSPNGQYAFMATRPSSAPNGDGIMGINGFMSRTQPGKFFNLSGLPMEFDSFTADRGGLADAVLRWAKDSSSFVLFKDMTRPDFPRSAYSIYVVPIVNGQPGNATDILVEILKAIDGDFVKANAKQIKEASYFFGRITDDELDDDLTFNNANQLVIDCICSNSLRDDRSYKGWTARFTGLYDPIQGKFVKESHTFVKSPDQDQASNPTPPAGSSLSKLKIETVRETKLGSGKYEVLDAIPIFYAESGIGMGAPKFESDPKGIDFTLQPDSHSTKAGTIKGMIGGPTGHFDGVLTETAANSGIFTDDKRTVTLTLPPGIIASARKQTVIEGTIDSQKLGFHGAEFSLCANSNPGPSLFFYSPIDSAAIKFAKSYDPKLTNHIHVDLRLQFMADSGNLPTESESFDLVESAPGSKSFGDPATGWTVVLNDFTGADSGPTAAMKATFYSKRLGALVTTLTKTGVGSLDYTQDITLGETPEYNKGTDEPPDDPEVTGDGVFRIRVKGGSGPVDLILKTDLSEVCVTAQPLPDNPSTAITGKLILVLHVATGNTHYRTIQTLYTGRVDESIQVQLAGSGSPQPSTAEDWVNRGAFKYNQGNLDEAIDDFDHALKIDPKSATAYANRGAAKAGKKNWDAAIADLDQALALTPKDADLYYNLGMIKEAKGDHGAAIADFSQAIALNSNAADAYNKRASAKLTKGDKEGALADYNQAIVLNPKLAEAHFNRGNLKQSQGDWSGALADYNKTVLIDPQYAAAYFNRGINKKANADLDGAVIDWRQFVVYAPTDSNADYARLYIWLARVEENEKKDADQDLSSAVGKTWIATPDAWVSKVAAFLLDRISEADLLSNAASSDPIKERGQHCEAWFYVGMKHLLAGDKTTAVADFQKCVATGQNDFMEFLLANAELKRMNASN